MSKLPGSKNILKVKPITVLKSKDAQTLFRKGELIKVVLNKEDLFATRILKISWSHHDTIIGKAVTDWVGFPDHVFKSSFRGLERFSDWLSNILKRHSLHATKRKDRITYYLTIEDFLKLKPMIQWLWRNDQVLEYVHQIPTNLDIPKIFESLKSLERVV